MVKDLLATAGGARDTDSIPGLGRFPGVGTGDLLQYSWLENSIDRGVRRAPVHGSQRVGQDCVRERGTGPLSIRLYLPQQPGLCLMPRWDD